MPGKCLPLSEPRLPNGPGGPKASRLRKGEEYLLITLLFICSFILRSRTVPIPETRFPKPQNGEVESVHTLHTPFEPEQDPGRGAPARAQGHGQKALNHPRSRRQTQTSETRR